MTGPRPTFPASGVRQTITVHQVNPLARWWQSIVDNATSRGLQGRTLVRWGQSERVFRGDLGAHQAFRGLALGHDGALIRTGFGTALPAGQGPTGDPNATLSPVQRLLAMAPVHR